MISNFYAIFILTLLGIGKNWQQWHPCVRLRYKLIRQKKASSEIEEALYRLISGFYFLNLNNNKVMANKPIRTKAQLERGTVGGGGIAVLVTVKSKLGIQFGLGQVSTMI